MAWEHVGTDSLQRGLGGLETVYYFASQSFKHIDKEQWLLRTTCYIEVQQGLQISQALRSAWRQLVGEHPSLAVTVKDYKAEFSATLLSGLETYDRFVDETFFVHQEQHADQVVDRYQLRQWPTLIYLPKCSQVMLITSHWRMDATGTCLLLDRLFQLTCQQLKKSASEGVNISTTTQSHIQRLAPPLEDAAHAPHEASREIKDTAGQVTAGFRQAAMKTIGLRFKGDHTTLPTSTSHVSVKLTTQSSRVLIDGCKTAGISVSAAVFTALGIAMFQSQQRLETSNQPSEFTTIMAVNMRPHLPDPYNTSAYACAAYVTSITPAIQEADTFLVSAKSLTARFKTWHSGSYNAALREIYAQASGALLNRPKPLPGGPPPPLPNGITLSSLGIVSNTIKTQYHSSEEDPETEAPIKVVDFDFQVNIFTRQMLMYLWTFDGQMHLSLNFNEAYYDAAVVQRLLQSIVDVLRSELKAKLDLCLTEM